MSTFRRTLEEIARGDLFHHPPDREPQAAAEPAPAAAGAGWAAAERRDHLKRRLARKILEQHLQRRSHALNSPDNLEGMGFEEAALLIRAMAAAAHADGEFDERERRRILQALATTRLDAGARQDLETEIEEPPCFESLARQVGNPDLAALFYAVCVVAAQRRNPVNRGFLNFVAQRLGLAADVVVRLNRRYGAQF